MWGTIRSCAVLMVIDMDSGWVTAVVGPFGPVIGAYMWGRWDLACQGSHGGGRVGWVPGGGRVGGGRGVLAGSFDPGVFNLRGLTLVRCSAHVCGVWGGVGVFVFVGRTF